MRHIICSVVVVIGNQQGIQERDWKEVQLGRKIGLRGVVRGYIRSGRIQRYGQNFFSPTVGRSPWEAENSWASP